MDSIEFLLIIAVFAVVMIWYLHNAEKGSDGLLGLLALADDPDTAKPAHKRRSYRIKPRIARRAHEMRDAASVKTTLTDAKPSFTPLDENARMRRRFQRQDETRYQVKDKVQAPDKPGRGAA